MPSRRTVLLLGGATVIASSTALSGLIYDFDARRQSRHGAFSLPDFGAVREALKIPPDVTIVSWDRIAKAGDSLGDVLDRLTADQILGLPERDQPYLLDASAGFYAYGVSEVQLADGTRQKVTSKAERWFSLARAPRGIVGLGPRAVVATTPTTWRSPAQPRPVSAEGMGRFYWDSAGTKQEELVGAQEKLIESEHPDAYFGNFTLVGPGDLGGVAYNGLSLSNGGTAERVDGSGAWRGFDGVPNGETGLVAVGSGKYMIANMMIDGRDPATGRRVGPSPIMINSSVGGTIDTVTVQCCVKGMPTNWNAQPNSVHRMIQFHSRWNGSHCLNLEQVGAGVEVDWVSGSLWRGRNPSHPSPDGIITASAHVGLDARGPLTITIGDDVDIDEDTLTLDRYGPAAATFGTQAKITAPVKVA